MGKTANLELNTTEMSDKISDFVGEYNSNMNMLDDLYGDVQDNASSALSTAQSADTKATAAQTAATNAVTTANSANTTAQSAVSTANSANTTAGQANTKADNAVATANTAKDTADEAKETAETASADVADKADVDGTYDSFTAGGAKQLLSTVYVDDNEPYNFRTAGGSADIGDRMYEEVVGGTVVWNSIADNNHFPSNDTRSGVTLNHTERTFSLDGTCTLAQGVTGWFHIAENAGSRLAGNNNDKLLVDFQHISGTVNEENATQPTVILDFRPDGNTPVKYGQSRVIALAQTSVIGQSQLQLGKDVVFNNAEFCLQVFNLTQMFGSTIADYIYSLEQGTAGAGVAWFRKLFPKPYYAYNAGELMSVKAGSHDTVGFNAWDEEWEQGGFWSGGQLRDDKNAIRSKNFIPVVPNTTYYFTADSGNSSSEKSAAYIFLYDEEKNLVHRYENIRQFSTTSDCSYIKFDTKDTYGTTYKNDICIHLAWDGERNGEYEPYEKHTYPLAELELRGIPKLDANNQLYYDGDTYASDGTVTRKYGIVDLGTLNGGAITTSSTYYLSVPNIYNRTSGTPNNAVCKTYSFENKWTADSLSDGCAMIRGDLSRVYIRDETCATFDDLKAKLNGVYLVYELATPTTETADTFVNPQVVDDFGTEEYVDYAVEAGDRDVAIPVGHNSQYMNNLRAKLEMAPDSPSSDGKYIVQQSNGENAYIPYTADGRLDAIEAKLPAPPSANGTYKLTAVVSNNGVTYSWQS